MAILITPDDVKEFCSTSLSDEAITALICVVQARMGACAESSYDECTAKQILIYATCALTESQSGEITSTKAANGSSVNYNYNGAGEGVKSTASGRLLAMIDTSGCYQSLFQQTVYFGSVGDANSVFE